MKLRHCVGAIALGLLSLPTYAMTCNNADQPLPLWQNSPRREAILDFVKEVTTPNSPEFVARSNRIAVIDNDGTLWSEKPTYVQFLFAFHQIKEKAKDHPKWKTETPYKWVLENQFAEVFKHSWGALLPILEASQANETPEQYREQVLAWLGTAKSPRFKRHYTDLVYQPMVELIDYLQEYGFKTYIVTGGGAAFIRPWSEAVYHIPPEQVIGTTFGLDYKTVDGKAELIKNAKLMYGDDGAEKAINIQKIIGKRPIFAIGNSTGDAEMLNWTTSQKGASLGMLVHHTDGVREWKYGPDSFEGKFTEKLMKEATAHHWQVINMKTDWCQIYPTQKEEKAIPKP